MNVDTHAATMRKPLVEVILRKACLNRFLPVVAAVLTLRSMSGLLEAVLLHSEARSGTVSACVAALAGSGAKTLGGLDVFVRELSDVALIIFMCALKLEPLGHMASNACAPAAMTRTHDLQLGNVKGLAASGLF